MSKGALSFGEVQSGRVLAIIFACFRRNLIERLRVNLVQHMPRIITLNRLFYAHVLARTLLLQHHLLFEFEKKSLTRLGIFLHLLVELDLLLFDLSSQIFDQLFLVIPHLVLGHGPLYLAPH